MKKYKIGDRIFYENYEGKICSRTIIEIKNSSYLNDRGESKPFQELITWKSDSGRMSFGIESYNCLSSNNSKCKQFAKQFSKYDKHKDEILNKLMSIISVFEKPVQEDIWRTLGLKIGGVTNEHME